MKSVSPEDITGRNVKKWASIALLISLPFAMAVSHFVDPGRGRAAGVSLALMILATRAFWYLRRQLWFWVTVAALTIIHAALIFVIPWTKKSFPAPELWPIGIADFAAICGIIKLVEKAVSRDEGGSIAS